MTRLRLSYCFNPLQVVLLVLLGLVLQGCGGGGGGEPADVDPTGYYDTIGTANVDDGIGGTLVITDLQAMVNNNRFIAISDSSGIVYDGMITNITGIDFTAMVSVYQNGALLSTSTIDGMITEDSSITGTLTGTGLGNGSFSLTYALSNNQDADLFRIQALNDNGVYWYDFVGGSAQTSIGQSFAFNVSSTGGMTGEGRSPDGVFANCIPMSGQISPVPGTSLYTATMVISECTDNTVNGDYAGLVITRSETAQDDRLVMVISTENFSIHGEFLKDN